MMNQNLWLAYFRIPRYFQKPYKGSVGTKPQKSVSQLYPWNSGMWLVMNILGNNSGTWILPDVGEIW